MIMEGKRKCLTMLLACKNIRIGFTPSISMSVQQIILLATKKRPRRLYLLYVLSGMVDTSTPKISQMALWVPWYNKWLSMSLIPFVCAQANILASLEFPDLIQSPHSEWNILSWYQLYPMFVCFPASFSAWVVSLNSSSTCFQECQFSSSTFACLYVWCSLQF